MSGQASHCSRRCAPQTPEVTVHHKNATRGERFIILLCTGAFLLLTVKPRKLSWFGHVCRLIRCRRSYDRAPWTEGVTEVYRVNRGKTTSKEWTGQPIPTLHRIAEERYRGKAPMSGHHSGGIYRGYPNDAWASRVLID